MKRDELFARVRQHAARPIGGTRNRQVTLLVQGELSHDVVTDPVNLRSQNLVFVDEERRRGNHICIVNDNGISALLRGEAAMCLRSRVIADDTVELSHPGPALLELPRLSPLTVGSPGTHAPSGLDLDLSGLDGGTAAHQETLAMLVRHLAPIGVMALSAPRVDAAWRAVDDPSVLFIAEVKSLTGVRQDQQIRLGIGQLLDYAYTVRERPPAAISEVRPVLVLEREPDAGRWTAWPPHSGSCCLLHRTFPGCRTDALGRSMDVPMGDGATGGPGSGLVHLAVTDGPSGDQVVLAPENREAARRLQSRLHGVFWCTTQAGGCGSRMHLVIGTLRRVHFRHARGATCALRDPDRVESSYEHLWYQWQLRDWLLRQGFQPRLEKVFTDGLGRTDVHVSVDGVEHSIEVQLSAISAEAREDRRTRYERAVDQLTWLFGKGARRAATEERASAGYALVLRRSGARLEPGGAGTVEIGLTGSELAETRWVPLARCSFNADGFNHPDTQAAIEAFNAAAESSCARRGGGR